MFTFDVVIPLLACGVGKLACAEIEPLIFALLVKSTVATAEFAELFAEPIDGAVV
jgi:hypothetical protein